MADPIPRAQLPPWGNDPLSTFLADAAHNQRATALNLPDVFEVQQSAVRVFARVCDVLENDPGDQNLLVPRMLVNRSRSAVLAAMGLAMSGQGSEAQPVLRVAVENAWYALHVARDPAPPARAEFWWGRDASPEATQAVRAEFSAGRVRRTHEALDAATAAAMGRLYESAITYGGHPNQGGVASSLRIDRSAGAVTVGIGVLHPDPLVTAATLKAAVDVTVGAARAAGLIYPERFRISGLDDEVTRLARHSAEVFTPERAEALRQLRGQ